MSFTLSTLDSLQSCHRFERVTILSGLLALNNSNLHHLVVVCKHYLSSAVCTVNKAQPDRTAFSYVPYAP